MTNKSDFFFLGILFGILLGMLIGNKLDQHQIKTQQNIINKLEIQLKISAPHSCIQDDNYDEKDIAIV